MTYSVEIRDIQTQSEECGGWWQRGMIAAPDGRAEEVGRWVEPDGSPCYDDHAEWCIEHDAARVLGLDYLTLLDWQRMDVPGAGDLLDAVEEVCEALRAAWAETPTWHVAASLERDGQILDMGQAEVLGDAYGVRYPSEAAAGSAARALRRALRETDLDPATVYYVDQD